MKREEVLSQYKWDLSSLFPNQDAFDENIRRCEELLTALKQMEGSICKDCESLSLIWKPVKHSAPVWTMHMSMRKCAVMWNLKRL